MYDDPLITFKDVAGETKIFDIVKAIAGREAKRIATARKKRGGLSEEKMQSMARELAETRAESILTSLEPVSEMPLSEVNSRFEIDDEASTGEKEGLSRIVISTVHSAKGLEWDNAYILDVNGSTWPPAWSGHTEDDLDEERRLFYVTITRARDNLFLVVGPSKDDTVFTPTPLLDKRVGVAMNRVYKKALYGFETSAFTIPTLNELNNKK